VSPTPLTRSAPSIGGPAAATTSSYPLDRVAAAIRYLRVRVAELERACASGSRASRWSAAQR